MNTFVKRAITGILFAATLIGAIIWNEISFSLLFLLVTIMGMAEFFRLISVSGARPHSIPGIITGILLFVSCYLSGKNLIEAKYFALIIPLAFLPFVFELYRHSETPFSNIGYTMLGIIYIAVPMALFVLAARRNDIYDPHIPLGFLFILWASDTGAYIFGSLMGKHKLFERISPKKTWEGLAGGAVISLVVAAIISVWFTELSLSQWMFMTVIIVVTGTYGDLAESQLKRSLGIKDSGNILPGHGGILDRFDALFYSVPFVWMYLLFT